MRKWPLAPAYPSDWARTGTTGSHFSGDIFLAFSTANEDALASTLATSVDHPGYATIRFLAWSRIDPLYEAVVQATEEAVINALVGAETTIGIRGGSRRRWSASWAEAPNN